MHSNKVKYLKQLIESNHFSKFLIFANLNMHSHKHTHKCTNSYRHICTCTYAQTSYAKLCISSRKHTKVSKSWICFAFAYRKSHLLYELFKTRSYNLFAILYAEKANPVHLNLWDLFWNAIILWEIFLSFRFDYSMRIHFKKDKRSKKEL